MTGEECPFSGPRGRALAAQIVERLAEFALPVTPCHYEVLFAYQTGAPAELVSDIDARLAGGQSLTRESSEALFERYFANARLSAQMVATGECIARELGEVIELLREAGSHTRDYGDALRAAAGVDAGSLDAAGFRRLVQGLVKATTEMVSHNQHLAAQMELSTRQVETLKTALQNVKVEALTDRLTGLPNRRLFDETLDAALRQAHEAQAPLCLLMGDIDHFKRFNDSWGHLIGDQVIRYVASAIGGEVPGDALAARYGGEEFAVILPRIDLGQGLAIAERIRAAIRSKQLTRRATGESLGAVTISLGLAQWRSGEAAAGLIERADRALYCSKRNGRDQVSADRAPAQAA